MSASLHYDVVVLGCGVAGLTAAVQLAEGGARVCVLAKGVGSTHLAPGTVDVLGHTPELVEEPRSALAEFVAAHPDHPYALVGQDAIEPALQWFTARIEQGPQPGYRYTGSLERNHLLPTALGAIRPSALVPETMVDGDARSKAPVCVVEIRAMRDFHASLCAGNLRRAGIPSRGIELDLDVGRVETNALGLARQLDDPRTRAVLASELAMLLRPEERLALPAVLGLRDPHGVWSDLRDRLGRPVFEIPTLPPSVPGMRVYNALLAALRAAGGRFILGAEVVGVEREGERVSAVRAHTSGRDTSFGARWVVMATGGFMSGAIDLRSDWEARERVIGLGAARRAGAGRAAVLGGLPWRAPDVAGRCRGRSFAPCPWHRECVRGRRRAGRSDPVAGGLGRGHRPFNRERRRTVGARTRSDSDGDGDNGMIEDLFHEELRNSIDHCVKCTICETVCPVASVTPLFPGPKYEGPQAERFRATEQDADESSVDYCSSCGLCTMSCPQGVKIAELNAHARYHVKQRKGVPLRDRIITRPTVLGRLGTPVAPLANAMLRLRPARVIADRALGIHRDAPVPKFAGRRFRTWARRHTSPTSAKRVVYFHGCGTEYYEPDGGEKVVAVLEHNGYHVEIPDQDCCGLPLQSSGLFEDARKYVLRLARALAPHARDGTLIVGNSTSCTLMLKREAREILGLENDPDLALVSRQTFDICELLLELHRSRRAEHGLPARQ